MADLLSGELVKLLSLCAVPGYCTQGSQTTSPSISRPHQVFSPKGVVSQFCNEEGTYSLFAGCSTPSSVHEFTHAQHEKYMQYCSLLEKELLSCARDMFPEILTALWKAFRLFQGVSGGVQGIFARFGWRCRYFQAI